ncbi:DUF2735 domain-containing protein [Mesorhizobium sp. NBSH29]|uniref:DUF2735 domain-containing protein n=1 Tax=Mesorhizobium sp. NBSH29 TaxID=2654249 RepID=UPI001896774B|nr:DUF2735 domain-containing protein [Mesorhizobium sp. NBSH29]QPC87812.1 DUF2735 domain-containing protein [Mesorhizobium sp. NBSH29]
MTYNIQGQTAQIYQFPVKLRAGAPWTGVISETPQCREPSRAALVALDAWYHDAAIGEEDKPHHS